MSWTLRWPPFFKKEAMAIRALMAAQASPAEQRLAMDTILDRFCNYDGLSIDTDDPHGTSHAEGRRFVAACIRRANKDALDSFLDPGATVAPRRAVGRNPVSRPGKREDDDA